MGVADLTISQKEFITVGIKDILSADEAENVSKIYGSALMSEMNGLPQGRLMGHSEVSRQIGENLYQMRVAAPATGNSVDSQELLGVMLELAGL